MPRKKCFLRLLARCAWLAAAVCGSTSAALADEAAVRAAVERLLESGWPASFQSRADVDRQFEQLSSDLRGNAKVRYALALIKVKQRRYSEALADLDGLDAGDATGRQAFKLRVWLLTMLKEYDAALVESEKAAEAFVADKNDPAQEAGAREIARFLGRIYGYLEGPAANFVAPAVRNRHEERLAATFTDQQREAFGAARSEVLEMFLDLTDEKEDTRRVALAEAEEERLRVLRDVQAVREEIQARGEELQKQEGKLRQQQAEELQKITSQDEPLAGEQSRLDGQARVVDRELAVLTSDIASLQLKALREKDPVERRFLEREASRLSLLASRYESDLSALEVQAAAIGAKRAELRRQGQQVEARFGGELEAIGKERSVLRRRARRADIDEKNAQKPNTGNTRRVRSLSAQTQAFTSYEPFPLEDAKQRLLESLKD